MANLKVKEDQMPNLEKQSSAGDNRMAQVTGLLWAVAAVLTAVSQLLHHG